MDDKEAAKEAAEEARRVMLLKLTEEEAHKLPVQDRYDWLCYCYQQSGMEAVRKLNPGHTMQNAVSYGSGRRVDPKEPRSVKSFVGSMRYKDD